MGTTRPKILYLSPCWPERKSHGSQLRALHVARALRELGDVHFVVAGYRDENGSTVTDRTEFPVDRFFPLQNIPRRKITSRIQQALDARSTHSFGHKVEATEAALLHDHTTKFDIVWLHNLRTADAFQRWNWPKSVMDLDDIPSDYERTVWLNAAGKLSKRVRAGFRMSRAKRRERLLHERFNVLCVCSEEDRRQLQVSAPVHVIPNGFPRPLEEPSPRPAVPPRIGFIGIFEYLPNAEGVTWFVEKCWPVIKRHIPETQLRLVGEKSDSSLKPNGPDVHGLGWLEDPAEEISSWSAMIVPLRVGAGTRVKIAEGFSRKCPVVSTSFGARGYDATNGREMFLADSPNDFAQACIRLIQNRMEAKAMVERAWTKFLEKWTWDAIQPRIIAAAEDCLRRNSSIT